MNISRIFGELRQSARRLRKQPSLKFQIAFVAFLSVIALSPESRADTIFSISGPDYTSCSGPYAVPSLTTCNQDYAISGTIATSASLSTIEAAGTGSYDITESLTSLSLTDGSDTVTLANLFTSGISYADFVVFVADGQITGWQFGGYDDSDLTYNPAENGYDGNAVGLSTSFGGPQASIDNTFILTGCTAGGTVAAACNGVLAGSAPSTFSELTITTDAVPEPGTLLMVGAGLLGLGLSKRRARC